MPISLSLSLALTSPQAGLSAGGGIPPTEVLLEWDDESGTPVALEWDNEAGVSTPVAWSI